VGSAPLVPQHWIGAFAHWERYNLEAWQSLVSVPPEWLKTHAIVIGRTGCGKTTLVHHLISQDVVLGHSFIILDLRGDLVTAVLEICAGRVDPTLVKILDLRERRRPLGFDPLSGGGEPYFRALHVLEVLAQESESWGVQLAETLRHALMLLAEAGRPLTELERLLTDSKWRRACQGIARTDGGSSFWARFDALSTDKQISLVMPVLNKASLIFATSSLRAILGHPAPLDLARHINTPGSILLVSLAGEELYAAGRMIGSLVLSSVCREIFARIGTPENRRNPVRLYVDEFEHFGSRDFETILAEGRRFGLSLVLAHQTLAQLSPRQRSLILNNVGTKFVFRTGREDGATLSRDLTGDPNAFDFVSYPVGRAAMWHSGQGVTEIEINAPLFQSVGALSPDGAAFLERVYSESHSQTVRIRRSMPEPAQASAPLPPAPRQSKVPPVRTSDDTRPASPLNVKPESLEDWLCK
jgi:hypothetical protein